MHSSASEIGCHKISLTIPFHVLPFHYLYGLIHIFSCKFYFKNLLLGGDLQFAFLANCNPHHFFS